MSKDKYYFLKVSCGMLFLILVILLTPSVAFACSCDTEYPWAIHNDCATGDTPVCDTFQSNNNGYCSCIPPCVCGDGRCEDYSIYVDYYTWTCAEDKTTCSQDCGCLETGRKEYTGDGGNHFMWNTDSTDKACCSNPSRDCVWNGVCYSTGAVADTNADGISDAYCYETMWINADYGDGFCAVAGGHWNTGYGEVDMDYQDIKPSFPPRIIYNATYIYGWTDSSGYCGYQKQFVSGFTRSKDCCCGDDAGEIYRTYSSYQACCDSSSDCVNYKSSCIASGTLADANGDAYGDDRFYEYCLNGVWRECETNTQCAAKNGKPYCYNNACQECNGIPVPSNYGQACGSCGGVITCDGSCSVSTPSNLNADCGSCGGKILCSGSCSVSTPSNWNTDCGSCGGKILCSGSCSVSTPSNLNSPCTSAANNCGTTNSGTINCAGVCSVSAPANEVIGQSCGSCGGVVQCGGSCSVSTPATYGNTCDGADTDSCKEGTIQCDLSCNDPVADNDVEVCDGVDNNCVAGIDETSECVMGSVGCSSSCTWNDCHVTSFNNTPTCYKDGENFVCLPGDGSSVSLTFTGSNCSFVNYVQVDFKSRTGSCILTYTSDTIKSQMSGSITGASSSVPNSRTLNYVFVGSSLPESCIGTTLDRYDFSLRTNAPGSSSVVRNYTSNLVLPVPLILSLCTTDGYVSYSSTRFPESPDFLVPDKSLTNNVISGVCSNYRSGNLVVSKPPAFFGSDVLPSKSCNPSEVSSYCLNLGYGFGIIETVNGVDRCVKCFDSPMPFNVMFSNIPVLSSPLSCVDLDGVCLDDFGARCGVLSSGLHVDPDCGTHKWMNCSSGNSFTSRIYNVSSQQNVTISKDFDKSCTPPDSFVHAENLSGSDCVFVNSSGGKERKVITSIVNINGVDLVCSNKGVWCLNGFAYDSDSGKCVRQSESCDFKEGNTMSVAGCSRFVAGTTLLNFADANYCFNTQNSPSGTKISDFCSPLTTIGTMTIYQWTNIKIK